MPVYPIRKDEHPSERRAPSTLPTGAARPLLGATTVLVLLLVVVPWEPAMPAAGLDASWGMVLDVAFARGWQWGRDVVYTLGPYGFVYGRLYHPDTYVPLLLIWGGLTLTFGFTLVRVLATAALPAAALAVATVIIVVARPPSDPILLGLPLLLGELWLRKNARRPDALLLALVLACALVSLAKTTAWILAAFVCLVLDGHRALAERRAPLVTPLFLLALVTFYVAAGQRLADVGSFVALMLVVAAGYGDAMQLTGPWAEVLAYLALAAVVAAAGIASGERTTRAARAICVGSFVLIAFKAGFVRHDAHASVAWGCLGLLAAVQARSRGAPGAVAVVMLLMVLGADAWWGSARAGVGAGSYLVHRTLATPVTQAATATAMLRRPLASVEAFPARFDAALGAIRAAHVLPAVDGPVDIVPSEQGVVLAHGLAYRPRPVFQEFADYAPALIAANRAHLVGPRAPRTILFGMETIDGRLPALVEGSLWPELARWYDPVSAAGDVVVLRRRSAPRVVAFGVSTAVEGRRAREIPVPEGISPVWATVALRKTVGGRLVGLPFKAPIVRAYLRTADGRLRAFRIVPALAEAGFVVSPLVLDARDAVPVLTGGATPASDRVVSIRVEVEPWGRGLYHRHFAVRFAPLVVEGARESPDG